MKKILLVVIRYYQSLPKNQTCRFYPSCSQYTYEAISRYGIIRGVLLGLKRISKCHPFNSGGLDPVKF